MYDRVADVGGCNLRSRSVKRAFCRSALSLESGNNDKPHMESE